MNLGGCSLFGGGSGSKSLLTVLAAAVPVGAIVAISNNDDAPASAAAGGGNMMTGTGGTTLPTTTINNIPTDNGDGTITWTVTFSRSISGITTNDFSVSGGTVTSVSPMSGTTVMVTTTHTSDGMLTLTYSGAGAMHRTSTAFDFTAPDLVNYLEDIGLGQTNQAESSHTFSTTAGATIMRNFYRTAIGTTTTLTVDQDGTTTTYEFSSAESNSGQLVSNNNDLLVLKNEGSEVGFHTIFTGTNVDGSATDSDRDFTSVDILLYNNMPTPHASMPTDSAVTYTGDYVIARVPSGTNSAQSGIVSEGTFSLTLNFPATLGTLTAINATGMAMEGTTQVGTFANGQVLRLGTDAGLNGLAFNGEGDLAGLAISMLGDFGGATGQEVIARGNADFNGGQHVIGLRGASQ